MSSINGAFPLHADLSQLPETTTEESRTHDAHPGSLEDARQLVRLVQCPQCSHPLREPVTLPCGKSLCKQCIPELRLRANISYPATANRLQGFTCPFTECKQEHAAGDCSIDVTLNKLMDVVRSEVIALKNTPEAPELLLRVEERDKWSIAGISSLREREVRTHVLPGGQLIATFTMADMGELAYDSEVSFTNMAAALDLETQSVTVLEQLKTATRSELDCQVCYALFLDPLTTSCGHTFCRKCIHRVLDHSSLCPICRRKLSIPPGIGADQAPSNAILMKLIGGLYPDALAARVEAAKAEDLNGVGELDTPLFICTLSFPTMPTFLHIFEPRYRLMIRRAVESGDRKFGMLLHNPHQIPQGDLGPVSFYQYGTMLHILNLQMMPDGRSLIETVGLHRFRVVRHGSRDGYTVGKTERVDDISIAAEEALEASELSEAANSRHFSAQDHFGAPPNHIPPRSLSLHELDAKSTQELMEIGTSFVKRMQDQSASWMHSRVFQAYGDLPDEDPAMFPWWFASVLPIVDEEKYRLLRTSSVRERLKICCGWIMRIEAQRWSQSSSCTVL